MENSMSFPISDIRDVLRACRADEPLPPGDPRWYDFSELRESDVVQEIAQILQASLPPGEFHRCLLCGHRGCGKSTELLRLKQWADEHGFLAVHTQVDVDLGITDLQFSDLYLLAVWLVERAQREASLSLPPGALAEVERWFAEEIQVAQETVKTELTAKAGVQIGTGLPWLGKLIADFFAAASAGSTQSREIRMRLRSAPRRLIEATNDILEAANESLRRQGRPHGLLLLFDNLDRYTPEQIDQALMSTAQLMRPMACHAVFTIPIYLEYRPPSGPIRDSYGFPVVLPMIPVRAKSMTWQGTVKESAYKEPAIQALVQALGRRIQLDALLEDPHEAYRLARMSGGCIRDLLHFVELAYRHSGERLTTVATDRAIRDMRDTYVRSLQREDYERLAQIARREPTPRDEQTVRLLNLRAVLEYSQAWLDVHPLIVEIEEFQNACRAVSPIEVS